MLVEVALVLDKSFFSQILVLGGHGDGGTVAIRVELGERGELHPFWHLLHHFDQLGLPAEGSEGKAVHRSGIIKVGIENVCDHRVAHLREAGHKKIAIIEIKSGHLVDRVFEQFGSLREFGHLERVAAVGDVKCLNPFADDLVCLFMGVESAVPQGDGSTFSGMIVRGGADPAEAEQDSPRLRSDEPDRLDDEGGVILDDKGAGQFVTTLEQFLRDKVEVLVAPATIEDLGTDDEGEEMGCFHGGIIAEID